MSKELKISGITVLKLSREGKIVDLIEAALLQNASSVPALSSISHNDAAMHQFGTTLQTVHTQFKAKPPLATKSDVSLAVGNLVDAYDENVSEIQIISRKKAKIAGDVNVGINIVLKAGYKLKSPKSPTQNSFEVESYRPGAVKIKTKAVAHHATYIRQYGKAPAKGVVPEDKDIEELMISPENNIRLGGLDSGYWYAFREASILPISRKTDSGTPLTNVEKMATPNAIENAHHRFFESKDKFRYNYGQWIWVLIL